MQENSPIHRLINKTVRRISMNRILRSIKQKWLLAFFIPAIILSQTRLSYGIVVDEFVSNGKIIPLGEMLIVEYPVNNLNSNVNSALSKIEDVHIWDFKGNELTTSRLNFVVFDILDPFLKDSLSQWINLDTPLNKNENFRLRLSTISVQFDSLLTKSIRSNNIYHEKSPWEFLKNLVKLTNYYDLLNANYTKQDDLKELFDHWYAGMLIQQELYRDAEQILVKLKETISVNLLVEVQRKLILIYSKHLQDFEKLKTLLIDIMKTYPGLPVSGFEWNSFMDYKAVGNALYSLSDQSMATQLKFVEDIEDHAEFNFTAALLQQFKGDLHLKYNDFKTAIHHYQKLLTDFESEGNTFFKSYINIFQQSCSRLIVIRLMLGEPTLDIYNDLINLKDDEEYKMEIIYAIERVQQNYIVLENQKIDLPSIQHLDRGKYTMDYYLPSWFGWRGLTISRMEWLTEETALYSLPYEKSKIIQTETTGTKVKLLTDQIRHGLIEGWQKIEIIETGKKGMGSLSCSRFYRNSRDTPWLEF